MENNTTITGTEADTKLGYQICEEDKILIFKFPLKTGMRNIWNDVREIFEGLEEPWTYHTVFDREHVDGYTTFGDMLPFAEWWMETFKGRDKGLWVITISNDPIVHDRYNKGAYAEVFPHRKFAIVNTMCEAANLLGGIKKMRHDACESETGQTDSVVLK